MKYSTKLSDAMHILAFIALHPNENLNSAQIAKSIQTNPAFVRQLMAKLSRAGIISSVKGHAQPALSLATDKITLLMVYRTIEGDKPLLHQDTHTNPECGVGINIQLVLSELYDEVQAKAEQAMAEATLAELLERYQKKIA